MGEPADLVAAAAAMLGTRLQQLFPIRRQAAEAAERLALHADAANVVVDPRPLSATARPRRGLPAHALPTPAPCGGDSIVIDGYRLLDQLHTGHPDLHAFLTSVDVDYFGCWTNPSLGVPHTPLVRRLVEHARAGRLVVRATATPVPREPHTARRTPHAARRHA